MFRTSSIIRFAMENIIKNSQLIEKNTQQLKEELAVLRNAYNQLRIQKLTEENAKLTTQVNNAIRRLVQLETARGVKQIPIPGQNKPQINAKGDTVAKCVAPEKLVLKQPEVAKTAEKAVSEKKEKKEKKVDSERKEKKQAQKEKKPDTDSLPVDVGRLDLRVGKILKAEKHPDADSLYVSNIECGDAAPRTVVSGLVKFVPIEELQGRMVVVLCNLKPAKMRGILSEAMVMCASTPEAVEVLSPPEGAKPGDPVECEGFTRQPDAQLNPKKKIFETVAPDLKTNDTLQACYMGKPLTVGGNSITSKSLKNVQIK